MRKRILLVILFPTTVFLWLAGWTLFWIGFQRRQSQVAARIEVMEIAEPISKEVIQDYGNNFSTKTKSGT